MKIIERLKLVVERLKQRRANELPKENVPLKEVQFSREPPKIGEPYVFKGYPSGFYKYDPELSRCVGGYRKGPHNTYVEKLMQLSNPSEKKE